MTFFRAAVAALLTSFVSGTALAQPAAPSGPITPGLRAPVECLIAEVIADACSPKLNGTEIIVTDGATSAECGNAGDTGLGANENKCRWSTAASAWILDSKTDDQLAAIPDMKVRHAGRLFFSVPEENKRVVDRLGDIFQRTGPG